MTAGVYSITNTVTGDRYVGASLHIEQRWQQHTKAMEQGLCGSASNRLLVESCSQYRIDAFVFEILEVWQRIPGKRKLLNQMEWDWVKNLIPH